MKLEELQKEASALPKHHRNKFFGLVAGVLAVSLFLVSVALSLYNSSGAAQLDLSRPGYQDVRKQAKRDVATKAYSSTGALDQKALDEFAKLYDEQVKKATAPGSYDAAALSEESLQLLANGRTSTTPAGQ